MPARLGGGSQHRRPLSRLPIPVTSIPQRRVPVNDFARGLDPSQSLVSARRSATSQSAPMSLLRRSRDWSSLTPRHQTVSTCYERLPCPTSRLATGSHWTKVALAAGMLRQFAAPRSQPRLSGPGSRPRCRDDAESPSRASDAIGASVPRCWQESIDFCANRAIMETSTNIAAQNPLQPQRESIRRPRRQAQREDAPRWDHSWLAQHARTGFSSA